jgi:hypothetical protein
MLFGVNADGIEDYSPQAGQSEFVVASSPTPSKSTRPWGKRRTDKLRLRPLGPPFISRGNRLMRTKNLLRLSACLAAAAALLGAAAPAQAASSEGTTATATSGCTELAPEVTTCLTLTERRNVIVTPSGVAILQGYREYSDSTTYPGGSQSSDGTRRYVSVFGSSIQTPDGTIYYDQKVARVDGKDVLSYSDGLTCVLDTNFVEANATGGYNHGTASCTAS